MRLRHARATSTRYDWPIHIIDDAGHVLFADQPEATLVALRSALAPHR